MFDDAAKLTGEAAEVLGDPNPLLDQVSTPEGFLALGKAASAWRLPKVQDAATLRLFLSHYRQHILEAVELPAILKAHQFAQQGFARDLIELDRQMEVVLVEKDLSAASRRVGRSKLKRLRPLRDQRVVMRYLQAVEENKAHGWHVLVYGLALQQFSLPLRQGLISYARQSLGGFVQSAAKSLPIGEEDVREIFEEAVEGLEERLNALIDARQPKLIQLV
ncbi:MAG TPA: urease accessory UreF family protein [Verrucomicrobiae bacterium]